MKRIAGILVVLILVSLAVGCSKSPSRSQDSAGNSGPSGGGAGTSAPPAKTTVATQPPTESWSAVAVVTPQMIVRNASLDLEVTDVSAAIDQISQVASRNGGFVVSSKVSGDPPKVTGSISIRVQAANFDQAMKSVRALAGKVVDESTSTQDVTQDYVDLQSRLRNLQATEQQLLKLMQQTANTQEALNVQKELSKVEGDIEQTKGRMQYLEQSSATSLINIDLISAAINAGFIASTTEILSGQEVAFRDASSGGSQPYSYAWTFGDNSTSDLKNPKHTYGKPGTYTVSLAIADEKGATASETKKGYITVDKGEGWSFGGTFGGAANTFVGVGKALATLGIYLLILAPFWGAILIIILVINWRSKKRKAGRT